jgi:hypothetical protein
MMERMYPWHQLALDISLSEGMDPHTSAGIDAGFKQQMADELCHDIQTGAIQCRDANGDPIRGAIPFEDLRRPVPLLTVDDGNAWLASRGYLQRWSPPELVHVEPSGFDVALLATRQELIDAFGKFTGMSKSWFSNLKDTPALMQARKLRGQGGRGRISASQYQAVHSGVLAKLPELAARVDPTCAEPTRCYFMPSCPPERHHLAETLGSFGGIEVDTAAMLAIPRNSSAAKQSAVPPAPLTLGFVMPSPVEEGGRNTALVAALGKAYAKGFTPEAVLPLAQAWGQGCAPPMDPAEIETAVRSMWSTHTRNHPAVTATPIPRGRLLTASELAALPALEWRVKGLLPAKGLASIYGPSGSGKTFVALDVACAISASAAKWFGAKVKGTPVAYVALEGSAGLSQRVKAWELHNGRTAPGAVRFILGGFTLLDPQHSVQLAEDVLANRCLNPAAFGMATCIKHGAHRSETVRRGADHGRYVHGKRTQEAMQAFSHAARKLRELESKAFAAGIMTGPRTRGRTPKPA